MQKRLPEGLAALALTGLFLLGLTALPAADDPPKLSGWSAPVNLGPVVNSTAYDACPTISKDGLSLFFRSNRPDSLHYPPPDDAYASFDIYVAQRDSVDAAWGAPVNLGPKVNTAYDEFCSSFSPDRHWMVFVRATYPSEGNCGAGYNQDLWITHRKDNRDDFGWETPVNLGCVVNSPSAENGPAWFEDEATGRTLLYFSSNRPGGSGLLDIYVSEALGDEKDEFGPPVPVTRLNTPSADYQPVLSKDGLELFFASNRPGGSGAVDLWTSKRGSTLDEMWFPPVNLGSLVNSLAADFHPTLSWDRTTLFFASERGGGLGQSDLWVTTRTKLRGPK